MSIIETTIINTKIKLAEGRIIVWQRISCIIQSLNNVPGNKIPNIAKTKKQIEIPVFILESETNRRHTHKRENAVPSAVNTCCT